MKNTLQTLIDGASYVYSQSIDSAYGCVLILNMNGNNKNKGKKNTPRRNRNNNRNNRRRPTSNYRRANIFVEKGDQTVVIKTVLGLSSFANATGASGIYTHGFNIITPYKFIQSSSYAPYLNIFDLMRLIKYYVNVYVPGASFNLGGEHAFKLYRDKRQNNGDVLYEGLIQERGHQRGKMIKRFQQNWHPIEPTDYDFYPLNSQLDDGRYGQINYAAISLPSPYSPQYAPIFEITMVIDFKYLDKPNVPSLYDFENLTIEDEEEERPKTPTTSNKSQYGVNRARIRDFKH